MQTKPILSWIQKSVKVQLDLPLFAKFPQVKSIHSNMTIHLKMKDFPSQILHSSRLLLGLKVTCV